MRQPASSRPSRRTRDPMAQADVAAGGLIAIATVLTLFARFAGPVLAQGYPAGFTLIPPVVGFAFFAAMVAQFLDRSRHGIARGILSGGALVLAVSALLYWGKVPRSTLLAAYWLPALLALAAAAVLVRGHQRVERETR